jgi:hypothetical protein
MAIKHRAVFVFLKLVISLNCLDADAHLPGSMSNSRTDGVYRFHTEKVAGAPHVALLHCSTVACCMLHVACYMMLLLSFGSDPHINNLEGAPQTCLLVRLASCQLPRLPQYHRV